MTDSDGLLVDSIQELARGLSGGQEGVGIHWNGHHRYWEASVSVALPRARPPGGRWRAAQGHNLTRALTELERLLLAETSARS